MNLYAILRRNGWKTPADLQAAAARSKNVGDTEMSNDVRWIRTYVMTEPDGTLGTVCIYEATSPEAITKHATRAELALTEIRQVVDTVIVREDPAK
jgi:thiamine biosynthesis protein ThiC